MRKCNRNRTITFSVVWLEQLIHVLNAHCTKEWRWDNDLQWNVVVLPTTIVIFLGGSKIIGLALTRSVKCKKLNYYTISGKNSFSNLPQKKKKHKIRWIFVYRHQKHHEKLEEKKPTPTNPYIYNNNKWVATNSIFPTKRIKYIIYQHHHQCEKQSLCVLIPVL